MLQAAQDFLTLANSLYNANVGQWANVNGVLQNNSTALNSASASLATATTSFAAAAAAMNNGNWASLNNNLVGLNQNVSDYRSTLFQHYMGLTNTLAAIPGDMANVINTALAGVMVANSNLASSTNLANLAGLAALTNLAGVIVLTNITDQLAQVNSNLLSMTNLGMSTESIQLMADEIGGSMTNAALLSAALNSNSLAMLKAPMETNLTWAEKTFTNAVDRFNVLKESTNWLRLIWDTLTTHTGHLERSTNLLHMLKAQGEEATAKRADMKTALDRLVEIQTTNSPRLTVNVTNYPNFNSEAAAAAGLAARDENMAAALNVLNGNHQAQTSNIPSLVPFVVAQAGVEFTAPPSAPWNVTIPNGLGGAVYTIDLNPMNGPFGGILRAFRVAIAWVEMVLFLTACAKIAQTALQGLAVPQLRFPSISVAGFSAGALAAPLFVVLYVGMAAAFSFAMSAVLNPGDGLAANIASLVTSNPFSAFNELGGPAAQGISLLNEVLPIGMMLAHMLWLMTSRYSIMLATWVFQQAVRLLPA